MDLPQSRFADALAFIIRHPFGYNQLDILPNLPPPRTASAIPSVGQRMNMAVTVLTKRTSFCLSLPRITCIVWLAWLAGLGLMWATYRLRVMHPHFLPLVLLLAVQVFGCVVVVCAGVWGVLRGPQRARALSCLLLATAPLWLWAGHISYGMWRAHSHNIPMDPLVKMGAAGGVMLIDAQTRYSYPNRLQGQRVVMIYDRAADPERDVAAMDRHLKRMEELIGRKQKSKVHWIRGSALSLGGRYFQGIALGSVCDGLPIADDELTGVDRHEVAHFALHHHCGPDKHPPSILVEGWAETQTGHKAGSLALRAWKQKQRGVVFSLRELTNDDLYNRSHRLVYVQGGALVDYLLREYGGEVFYELFTTTCPETFAADCRRVLGVDLDELDRRYWSDVERQVIAMGDASRENPLRDVVLGEGVDQGAWEALVENYAATIEQRNELFRQVQMEIESTGHDYSEEGAKTIPSEKFILAFDGDCQRKMCEELGRIRVTVANPRQSFTLFKKTGEPEWNWRGHSDVPQFEYRSCYMYSLSRIYSLIQPYKPSRPKFAIE